MRRLLLELSKIAEITIFCISSIVGVACTKSESEEQTAFIQVMDKTLINMLSDRLAKRGIPHSIVGDRLHYPHDKKSDVERAFSESLAIAPQTFILSNEVMMEYFLDGLNRGGIVVLSFGPENQDGQSIYRVNVRKSDQDAASEVFRAVMKGEAMKAVPDTDPP